MRNARSCLIIRSEKLQKSCLDRRADSNPIAEALEPFLALAIAKNLAALPNEARQG
jgi:hypothetical protein